ncbi:HD domain-containing protein [Pelotomaculum isophthalicicum JI]|uniref:HD domain-containing protein n=1 Tax=Pelotomaculum isophthalicicum JI TaxID=947010 RepID=A0A9X4H7C1_9FIRM|nr:HD domain-containing protein [Pelotomaculum isophthalicicum]MDF9407639.1 HD domain-containing protein [Pelotomaculum isophthalicicum JI]
MKTLLSSIQQICADNHQAAFIVGGYLRDILLGRKPGDIDLALEEPARNLVKELARKLDGTLVILDGKRSVYRLIINTKNSSSQIDIEGINPGGLLSDQARRDFTINALAVPLDQYLHNPCWKECIIDPMGGLADLQRGTIRVCSETSIENDPLRALRAFRLAANLGLVLEPGAIRLIAQLQKQVLACAGERIWDELAAIFIHPQSVPVIRLMDTECGLLEKIIPELAPLKDMVQGGHHTDDAWEHSLKTLEIFERIIDSGLPSDLNDKIIGYTSKKITRSRNRLPALKLACLLHDVGKQFCREYAGNGKYTFYNHHKLGVPVAGAVAGRLKLSGAENQIIKTLVGSHMDPLFLYKDNPPSPRALRRFFSRSGLETTGLLLLSLADITASRTASGHKDEAWSYRKFILDLLNKYLNENNRYVSPSRLLDGNDICVILGIKPSKRVGRVLESLADAQVEGLARTKEEAVAFIKQYKRPT